MSVRRLADVLDYSQATGSTRLVLLAIANAANEEGIAWPGLDHIARHARVSRSSVIRHVQKAVELGELVIVKEGGAGPRDTNVYRLAIEGCQSDTPGSSKGVKTPPKRVSPVTPEPRKNQEQGVGKPTPAADEESADERSRRRDALWDAMEQVAGHQAVSKAERGRWGMAQAELLELGATPDEFRRAWNAYKQAYPGAAINPQAVIAHWGEFIAPTPGGGERPVWVTCPECDGAQWLEPLVDGVVVTERCPRCEGRGKIRKGEAA